MIITGTCPLEIGKVYNEATLLVPFEYRSERVNKFAFKVIRESTREEFLDYVRDEHPDIFLKIKICKYFYEIQTD